MIFIEKLGALLKANVPLLTAIELLSNTSTSSDKKIITAIKKEISAGLTLSQALAKFPKVFDLLTVSLIKAGEESASLTQICEHITNYSTKILHLKRRIKKALFYPGLLLLITAIISVGLLVFIVPQFEQLFDNAGAKLPLLTQTIVAVSAALQEKYYTIIICFTIILILLLYFKKRILDYLLHVPLLGNILKKIILSRFAYTLSVVLLAGIPLTQSLLTSKQVLQNKKFEQALINIIAKVARGEKLSESFKQSPLFPTLFIQFLTIGEQSSSVSFYLNRLAHVYDEETDQQLNTLTFLIEPLIMLILGLLIGGMIIAMYLPIFELGKVV